MNFELTQDQQLLVDTAQSFVRRDSPVSRFRELREDPLGLGYAPKVWQQMAEFGWLGLCFPESVGGSGASFAELALMLEPLASTLVPEPLVPNLLAGKAIERLGSAEQQAQWLAPMIAGELTLALAFSEADSRFDVGHVSLTAEKQQGGYLLRGKKRWVLHGHAAKALVVSARTQGLVAERQGISLFIVSRDLPGVRITPVKTMDGGRAAMVELDGVQLTEAERLGQEGEGLAVLEELMDLGAACACAEGAGITRAVLDMTCDYLRTREQFGVKIGSFQALQHRAVDMFVETELCKSMALGAAIKMSEPCSTAEEIIERQSVISAAKVQLAQGGRLVTQQAIQLHGGIGITDEHDIGLYFKRMHVLATIYGDEDFHVRRFARLPSFTAALSA